MLHGASWSLLQFCGYALACGAVKRSQELQVGSVRGWVCVAPDYQWAHMTGAAGVPPDLPTDRSRLRPHRPAYSLQTLLRKAQKADWYPALSATHSVCYMGPSRPASQLHTANALLHCPPNPLVSPSTFLLTQPHPVQSELHKAERIASELMGATWHPEISGMAKSLKRPDADLPSYMRLSAQRTSKTQVGWGWRLQVLPKMCPIS